jgi:hypothetical protein
MADIVVSGNSSGSVTLRAPDVSGTTILTLPTTTGTLVVTGGAQTIEFADGTVSAPSITNSGDTNTGIYFPAADAIAFTEGGVESMRIDSSGRLGVGTVSPSVRLEVADAGTGTGELRVTGSSNGFQIYTDNANTTLGTYTNIPLVFRTNASERMRIGSDGNITFKGSYVSFNDNGYIRNDIANSFAIQAGSSSSVGFQLRDAGNSNTLLSMNGTNGFSLALQGASSVAGTGITFPATQVASSNANTLDDYEEGTWTPALTFGGNSVGVVYSAREARYVKIGRSVFACCLLVITSKGSSSGIVGITLPFTTSPNTYSSAAFSSNGVSLGGGSYNLSCQAGASAVALNFYNQVSGTSKTACTDAQFANSSEVIFGFTYEVA